MDNIINVIANSRKMKNFIFYETILIIGFTIAYLLSDIFLDNYPEFSKNIGLGSIKKVDTFYSYLYFSLITQSTVGFGGVLPDGNNIVKTNSNILKILSGLQLYSVIIMIAYTLS